MSAPPLRLANDRSSPDRLRYDFTAASASASPLARPLRPLPASWLVRLPLRITLPPTSLADYGTGSSTGEVSLSRSSTPAVCIRWLHVDIGAVRLVRVSSHCRSPALPPHINDSHAVARTRWHVALPPIAHAAVQSPRRSAPRGPPPGSLPSLRASQLRTELEAPDPTPSGLD